MHDRIVRLILATFIVGGVMLILSIVHDYPRTRDQLRLLRNNDPIATDRPWVSVFYFFNEAGSGLKYLITGNEKHMRHYPSELYLLTNDSRLAGQGDWRAQLKLASRYHDGNGVERDETIALFWLKAAYINAPLQYQDDIAENIRRIEDENAASVPTVQ